MVRRLIPVLILVAVFVTACKPISNQPILTVMVHNAFSISETILREFEDTNGVRLVFLKSGDAGAMVNRAILTKGTPLADVIYGVDSTFLSRAIEADIFEPYESPLLAEIPDSFKLDSSFGAVPVDFGDICINYDKAYFLQSGLAVPQSLEELTRPEYSGLLVVENPSISSPGLAFLLATIAHFGQDGYLEFWADLRGNNVVVASDWETAYYTHFSASSGRGAQPMVVSYATSPVAEFVFATEPLADSPTASIIAPHTCYRQVEFAGILRGTNQRVFAEKFIDFMLGVDFQEDIPLQMFMYPVNRQAKIPDVFNLYATIPEEPAQLDPDLIAENRAVWLQAWDEVVLR